MTIDQLLNFALEHGASDIHLQAGASPQVRIVGQMRALDTLPLTGEQLRQIIRAIGPPVIIDDIDQAMVRGYDFAYSLPGVARFRCNLYSHLGTPGLAIRVILPRIRTIDELHLPP